MSINNYRQVWDLDSIYQKGSSSNELHNDIQTIEERLRLLMNSLSTITIAEDASFVLTILIDFGDIKLKLAQVTSFLTCLFAQPPLDEAASVIQNKIANLNSEYNVQLTKFQAIIANVPLKIWIEIFKSNVLKDFELVVLPGVGHSMGERFGEHKRYDFFVRHLMEVNPPKWDEIGQ